jgi:hypothetical protein
MRQHREGGIRQVLRSMQGSPAALFCGQRERIEDRGRGCFFPRLFFRPAPARRSPYVVPTDANLRMPDRLRGDATQELSPCVKNQDAASRPTPPPPRRSARMLLCEWLQGSNVFVESSIRNRDQAFVKALLINPRLLPLANKITLRLASKGVGTVAARRSDKRVCIIFSSLRAPPHGTSWNVGR